MTDGADLLPWATSMLLEWHLADPVSWKEQERNAVISGLQQNRNPFIDRPELAVLAFGAPTGVRPEPSISFALGPNAPNPFGSSTVIRYTVPGRAGVSLRVYNTAGRLVRELAAGDRAEPGSHAVTWDGRDRSGRRVASGVYFYRLEAGENRATRKMLLLR
jgi:hypothetical protein